MHTQNLMRDPQLVMTKDGSHSLWVPELKESYHSTHGAIQEAEHVFIRHGLLHGLSRKMESRISILEIGLGTGLNALLTCLVSSTKRVLVAYTGLEPYPVPYKYVQRLNYVAQLTPKRDHAIASKDLRVIFEKLHQGVSASACRLSDYFLFKKSNCPLQAFSAPPNTFDIVYFDAFSPGRQPTMWSRDMLQKVYHMMKCDGILVTYCAQGKFKNNLRQLGMYVEALPGPPGKREMTRAQKQE